MKKRCSLLNIINVSLFLVWSVGLSEALADENPDIPFLDENYSANHGGASVGTLIEISSQPKGEPSVETEAESMPTVSEEESRFNNLLEVMGFFDDPETEEMPTKDTVGTNVVEFWDLLHPEWVNFDV